MSRRKAKRGNRQGHAAPPENIHLNAEDPDQTVWIMSNPRLNTELDTEPTCVFRWGDHSGKVSCALVRQAAEDLNTVSAMADTIAWLRNSMDMDPEHATAAVRDLIGAMGHQRDHFGLREYITFTPGAARQGPEGVVLFKGPGGHGVVTPAGARAMATQWIETVAATVLEEALALSLRDIGGLEDEHIQALYRYAALIGEMKKPGADTLRRQDLERLRAMFADMPEDPDPAPEDAPA